MPLLLYRGALLPLGDDPPAQVEAVFRKNGWQGLWRNGIYDYHHYHSEAHEALGVYRGSAKVQFGGPNGPGVQVAAGDAVVLPAGTAHKLVEASRDFAVVGAYPPGQHPDLCHGKPGEQAGSAKRIRQVPLPATDPVVGSGGLVRLWSARGTAPGSRRE
jgi:uncharacterized protein YjlB